ATHYRHPLSLHDALPIWGDLPYSDLQATKGVPNLIADMNQSDIQFSVHDGDLKAGNATPNSQTPTTCSDALYQQGLTYFNSLNRSEEHTSELQSRSDLVC